jgi:hypothetical protein
MPASVCFLVFILRFRSQLPLAEDTYKNLPLNGVRLRVRLVEVEINRLKLDSKNPRLLGPVPRA